jgi:hypothetical protein
MDLKRRGTNQNGLKMQLLLQRKTFCFEIIFIFIIEGAESFGQPVVSSNGSSPIMLHLQDAS